MAKAVLLSPRQTEVLTLLEQGFLLKEVGERLGISLSTVKKHCGKIYRKSGVGNAREAIWRARYVQQR